ncbi:hypothetical protein HNQ94_000023 [Salirhabdus euzebyi]|uniref:Uncharacterized protein n=1 Tax=Salirhabdus euzebyi TaxID=394506 RepID=A0A841Q152_9BACI|nr:hypothetical protein [Salirhabdus euzebyi]MBB6451602.1 hypothetical protein [Salirhabdus euzebyi]
MAKPWKDDQEYLINSIVEYRNLINGKDVKEAKRMTKNFAEKLHKNNPELKHRTIQSIVERLPYLDNLLAGVFKKENYAKKDQNLYSKVPRENNDLTPNYCNTRHSYNGAIR